MIHRHAADKQVVGFIPARGGSKSIPKKNLVDFGGRPLIDYVINAGKASAGISTLVCSTDDKEIADHCYAKEVEVDWRPAHLAQDDSHIVDVVIEFLGRLPVLPTAVALLQPTSPLILPEQINDAIRLLDQNPACSSVQTISMVPHNNHAFNQREITEGNVQFRFLQERLKMFNKQKKPPLFVFANLVITRCNAILEKKNLFSDPSLPLIVTRNYAFDLDTFDDVAYGEYLLKQ